MKKSHRLITSLIVAAASFAAVAGAQAQTSTSGGYSIAAPGNSYIDLGVGGSDFKVGNGIGAFGSGQGDTSYSIRAGSYFNNNFGLEIGYTDFGHIDRAGGNTKADGINLSLLGKMPLSPSFNLLGKIGTTYGRTDVSSNPASGITSGTESDFAWSYGVGGEFAFNPQWSAVFQYEEHNLKFPGGNRERISATTLSARYRF
jgi:opacity protein-like surface antigen